MLQKCSSSAQNVRESSSANRDLKHSAVPAGLEIEAVPKDKFGRGRIDVDDRRSKPVVGNSVRIWCVERFTHRHRGIGIRDGLPGRSLSGVYRTPAGRQRRRSGIETFEK